MTAGSDILNTGTNLEQDNHMYKEEVTAMSHDVIAMSHDVIAMSHDVILTSDILSWKVLVK